MDMEKAIVRRKGWIAVSMGLTMPGMGQIYNGEFLKGISVFVIFIMTYIAGMRFSVYLPDRLLIAGASLTTAAVLAIYIAAIIDGYKIASREMKTCREMMLNKWYIYIAVWMIESVLIVGFAGGYVRGDVMEAYKIVATSMEPKVLKGDRVLVDKTAYRKISPMVGDIVFFVYPDDRSKVFIRQIAGLPGDTVSLADGSKAVVPHGYAYLLGTADKSIDSRSFGFIPLRDLLGKARQIYWSTEPMRCRWERIGMTLSNSHN